MLSTWGVSYALVAIFLPFGGLLLVGVSTFVATICMTVVAGLLYARAIGSPLGPVLAPFVVVILLPSYVFERLAFGKDVVFVQGTATSLLVAVPSAFVGIFVAFATIGYGYSRMEDPVAWEREVMPLGVRILEPRPSSETAYLAPRIDTEREQMPQFDIVSGTKAMVVALGLIAVSLFVTTRYGRFPPTRAGGPILLALVYVVANAYTYDE